MRILRYTVENFRSFRDEAELSFVSTARKDEPSWRSASQRVPHGVLPVVGIWGANASGKSNLLAGLMLLRQLVAVSFAELRPDAKLPWTPFRLRKGVDAPSTRMELDFLLDDDTRLHFGFVFRDSGFSEEWLYRWTGSRRQVLYERDHSQDEAWYFGPSLKGERRQIAAATRRNSLFLSAAAQFNHELLAPMHGALVSGIRQAKEIGLSRYPLFDPAAPLLTPSLRPVLKQFMGAVDVGVVDLEVKAVERRSPPPDIGQVFQPEFLAEHPELLSSVRELADATLVRVQFMHAAEVGEPWVLPSEAESRGTQILLRRLEDFIDVLSHGGLLVVDELDTSLHPDLCASLVALFTSESTNPCGAQLLFTTHDRGLLRGLRTDEVVFVDKGGEGESRLAYASDYRGVRGGRDLRHAHERGSLRGVPVLGDLRAILEEGLRGEA